jgi:hypothetical protein
MTGSLYITKGNFTGRVGYNGYHAVVRCAPVIVTVLGFFKIEININKKSSATL